MFYYSGRLKNAWVDLGQCANSLISVCLAVPTKRKVKVARYCWCPFYVLKLFKVIQWLVRFFRVCVTFIAFSVLKQGVGGGTVTSSGYYRLWCVPKRDGWRTIVFLYCWKFLSLKNMFFLSSLLESGVSAQRQPWIFTRRSINRIQLKLLL